MAPLKDLRDLIRFPLCILGSLTGVAGGFVGLKLESPQIALWDLFLDHIWLVFYGVSIPFLVVGGGQAYNDYIDFEADKANNRIDRPLVRGAFGGNKGFAKWLAISFLVLGCLICLVLFGDLILFLGTVLFASFAFTYSAILKKTGLPGNIIVSASYMAPFLLGSMAAGLTNPQGQMTIILVSTMVFFAALGREIVKGVMDVEGDRIAGVKTVAVTRGLKTAGYISAFFFVIALILSFPPMFPPFSFQNNPGYLVFILQTDFLLIYSSFVIIRDPSVESGKRGRHLTRLGVWTAALAFFGGALFVTG